MRITIAFAIAFAAASAGLGYVANLYMDEREARAVAENRTEDIEESFRRYGEAVNETFIQQQRESDELTKKYQEAQQQADNFDKEVASHDLEKIALSKPAMLERRINDGTAKLHSQLEEASRSRGIGDATEDSSGKTPTP